jgi:branched-chain amino acid transport system substrate-binding protein
LHVARKTSRDGVIVGGLVLFAKDKLSKGGKVMKKTCSVVCVMVVGLWFSLANVGYAQKAPYLIGFMSDLTGRYSTLGIANKRGLEIAIEEINAAGGINGRQLKAVFYDGESDTAKGVLHTKRLIDVDKAVVLTGYTASGTALACIQTVEAGTTPLLSAGSSEKIWVPTKKWMFNVVPRQKEASIPMLLEILQQKGAKKIAYIYIDMVYGHTGKETFDSAIKDMNITPAIVEKYAPGSTDVGPQITHIKAAGADGLLITGLVPDTTMVIKNARDMGFTQPIISDYAIVGPEFIDLAGNNAEGIVTTSLKTMVALDLPANDIQKKVAMDLYSKYTRLHGSFSLYAGHTWDQVYLVAEALKKVDPKLDPANAADVARIREQIRDNLEQIKGFVGQNGVFNYSADNHNGLGPKCYVPVVVENGKWKLYKGK